MKWPSVQHPEVCPAAPEGFLVVMDSLIGYVAGNLCYKARGESRWTDCGMSVGDGGGGDGGVAIGSLWTRCAASSCSESEIDIRSEARFLLLIEKEGIFRRLCEDQLHRYGAVCGIVTTRGESDCHVLFLYPDDCLASW